MNITFFGHSDACINKSLIENIKKAIIDNININEKTIFYCGGYGAFDNACAYACVELKRDIKNSEIALVVPYLLSKKQVDLLNIPYDQIVYPPLECFPKKIAILKRNEWMINNSDLIISFIERSFGGAYKAFCYAKKKEKKIINLA